VLVGVIRTTQTQEFTVEGQSLAELQAAADALLPEGHVLLDVRPHMAKGTTTLTGTVKTRRHELSEIRADTMEALRAAVPEGWALVSVRAA